MNVEEKMDFLGFKDVSTKRQKKNGTQIFELPIKCGNTYIKVGTFKSGYVRRMNHCYTPYQLNKCKPYTEYYKHYEWNKECTEQTFNGKYRKYVGKQRIVIPDKVDRLNYLISYCLKNFYIGYANQVADGKFIPKWEHEWELKQASNNEWKDKYDKLMDNFGDLSCAHEELVLGLDGKYNAKKPDVSITIDGMRYKVI